VIKKYSVLCRFVKTEKNLSVQTQKCFDSNNGEEKNLEKQNNTFLELKLINV